MGVFALMEKIMIFNMKITLHANVPDTDVTES